MNLPDGRLAAAQEIADRLVGSAKRYYEDAEIDAMRARNAMLWSHAERLGVDRSVARLLGGRGDADRTFAGCAATPHIPERVGRLASSGLHAWARAYWGLDADVRDVVEVALRRAMRTAEAEAEAARAAELPMVATALNGDEVEFRALLEMTRARPEPEPVAPNITIRIQAHCGADITGT